MNSYAMHVPSFNAQLATMNRFSAVCHESKPDMGVVKQTFAEVQRDVFIPNGPVKDIDPDTFEFPRVASQLPTFMKDVEQYSRRLFNGKGVRRLEDCIEFNNPNACRSIDVDVVKEACMRKLISRGVAHVMVVTIRGLHSLDIKTGLSIFGALAVPTTAFAGATLAIGDPLTGGLVASITILPSVLECRSRIRGWQSSFLSDLQQMLRACRSR